MNKTGEEMQGKQQQEGTEDGSRKVRGTVSKPLASRVMLYTHTSLGQRENVGEKSQLCWWSKNALKQRKNKDLKKWRLIKRRPVDFKVKGKYGKLGKTIRKPWGTGYLNGTEWRLAEDYHSPRAHTLRHGCQSRASCSQKERTLWFITGPDGKKKQLSIRKKKNHNNKAYLKGLFLN